MGVEPGNSTAQEADRCGLLLVRQHFHVGQSGGVVDRNVHAVVADAGRAALLTVAGDAVADFPESSQLPLLRRSLQLDVDVDQVARPLPLVAVDWWSLLRRSASARGPGFAIARAPGGSELWPRWRRERPAAWRCGAGAGVDA